mmetsp:Transcript_33078/g.37967  ORF Transcript_33078/g.37967 Transcript_33078/m.37967 type:complete len:141 (-) Transcript_33078:1467-1889(-)
MCTLKPPFDSKTVGGLYLKIVKGQYMPISQRYSKELSEIVASCLQKDGRDRPFIQEILENPKLKKMAHALGHKIPSGDEITKEVKCQKQNMISTFAKKKTQQRFGDNQSQTKENLGYSQFRKAELYKNSKLSKPIVTNSK